jgi:HAD superfamily hydrolase (TIGR01450 family)
MDFRSMRGFIFDLDGCVYTGESLVPGVRELLRLLRARGRAVCFLTNNSRQDSAELLAKLVRLGIPASREEVVSAVEVAPSYVRERYGPSRLLAVGSNTLMRLLGEAGHSLLAPAEYRKAEVVLLGADFDFTYEKLTAAARAVARGLPFVAVNMDARMPVENGEFFPGCASMVAAVEAATGRRPEVVGKPMAPIFQEALRLLGVPASHAVMIGDSLFADIEGADRAGLHTIWLSTNGDARGSNSPDFTIHSFSELQGRL